MGLEVIVLSEEASMRENTRRNPIAVLGVATGTRFCSNSLPVVV